MQYGIFLTEATMKLGYIAKRTALWCKNYLTEGWYYGDEGSKNRLRLLKLNILNNINGALTGGNCWTAFLLILAAGNDAARDNFVGTLAIITTACSLVPMFSTVLLERFKRRKPLVTAVHIFSIISNVVFVGIVPFFPGDVQTKLTICAVIMGAKTLIGTLVGPAGTAWHMQSLPEQFRGGYYATNNLVSSVVSALIGLVVARFVDRFGAANLSTLLILRAVSLVLYAFDVIIYLRLPEHPYEGSSHIRITDVFTMPFKNRKYLPTVFIPFLWNIAVALPGGYYGIYLLDDLKLSFSFMSVIVMFNIPITFLLTPTWKRIFAKFGWFKTMAFSMLIYSLQFPMQGLVTASTRWMYPVAQIWIMVFGMGINLVNSGIAYVNLPEENQTVYLAFYSTVNTIASLLGAALGKSFIMHTEELHISLFGLDFCNKQLIMFLSFALILCAVAAALTIIKKTSAHKEA